MSSRWLYLCGAFLANIQSTAIAAYAIFLRYLVGLDSRWLRVSLHMVQTCRDSLPNADLVVN